MGAIIDLVEDREGDLTLNAVTAWGSKERGLPQYKLACEARKRAKLEESRQISDQDDLFLVTEKKAAPPEKEERPSRPRKKVIKKLVATS